MVAAYPLPSPAEIARAKAIAQIHVLMRAGGVLVTEDEVAAALRTMPDERLLAMPGELAEALDWHRVHAPAEIPRIFRAELAQLQRHAAAGEPPLTDDDIEAEIQAARAERDLRAS